MSDFPRTGSASLAEQLAVTLDGDVLFDAFSRGRYSTDASAYQITPLGVVVPDSYDDVKKTLTAARQEATPLLARGGGTSQCGQTVGEAVVMDVTKHLNKVLDFDPDERTVWVEPGIVLDHLNAFLRPHGLWFPVDVSTASRATIGGMAGNNSCGARSLHYGVMRDNVLEIEALLADGSEMTFGELPPDLDDAGFSKEHRALVDQLLALGIREAEEIDRRFPKLMRRVGGYNIDALVPSNRPINLAHLLVGSEGTLAYSKRIKLKLSPLPEHKVLGICHFPTFYQAMESAQHLVKLGPAAVELVDRTMIDLSRDIPLFRPIMDKAVRGNPEALLLVEFAGDDRDKLLAQLQSLVDCMADLGLPEGVVEVTDGFQKEVWEVRKAGLNIMMSMKGDGKPISFIEDCAVDLKDLAEYTDRLTKIFHENGTTGTWYAHASVGCLHVRPVLNLRQELDVQKMRTIAEKAFELVREYKGSHSGEHGDGLVRSEFHEAMFGSRMVRNFKEVKALLDPQNLMNPGKIVHATKMDDRSLFRFKPGYKTQVPDTVLDWSDWGGFAGAVEMCNNNGACRKSDANVMCPSFRATGDERHLTRGRANSLRLAISGQLGPDAFTSDEMLETMKLCVSCKGCKRECPTGVDMARMKLEFLYHHAKRHGVKLRERLVGYLPRYAPYARHLGPLLTLRDKIPALARLSEKFLGLSARRPLPLWHRAPFNGPREVKVCEKAYPPSNGRDVVLWVDTFNLYQEPENARAALKVLAAAGYRVHVPQAADGGRPLCCGRTFFSAGLVDEAKTEASRLIGALTPFVEQGIPIVGLEPSCLLSLRDEYSVLFGQELIGKITDNSYLLEEFLAKEDEAGHLQLNLQPAPGQKVLLHGHCHQKAHAVMGAVEQSLRLIPELEVETVASSCCGMAGAFGYQAETYDLSMKMAEANLLPAVRAADADTLIVADGTSCRHQIKDGTSRQAQHVARVLAQALPPKGEKSPE
ncbi:FAD-binding and (Fe-S)-binding domain-containing protein [Rhodovibrionaceae bacterium A322]